MRYQYSAISYSEEPDAETKLLIAENHRRHEEAKAEAIGSGIYVLCDSVVYSPRGVACAIRAAEHFEDFEELVRLANLQLKGA